MSYTIPKKVYEKFIAAHESWKKMQFVNHGLGFMRLEEHQELVKIGAIKCYRGNGNDAIIADYPKLLVRRANGDEETIDMNGDVFQITQERDLLQRQGKHATIQYFPRKFNNWLNSRKVQAPPMPTLDEDIMPVPSF